MFPDAKLRVVNALKANGEVVAMSGDGVNDGPALKAAHIGVAMGKAGTEIAKSAASLVLLKDNLKAMVTAIQMGRRIYDNLRKAIRYIISIHLPIVLVVLLPLLLGWPYAHILLPLHVIFLELVMDPTAAIAFENEPGEPNLMRKPPRTSGASLFSGRELGLSLLQGAVIAAGVLFVYQLAVGQGKTEEGVRAMVFATMVISNLFLTFATRSFDYALNRTLFYKNPSLVFIVGISLAMLAAILYWPFLAGLFQVTPLSWKDIGTCTLVGIGSVGWFEVYKAVKSWHTDSPAKAHDSHR
jgi:Ca2+-transporting ATPase